MRLFANKGRISGLFTEAYETLLGHTQARAVDIDLDFLELERLDLFDLDKIFTEKEVGSMIKDLPQDRATGLDGFVGAFYQ